MSHFDDLEPIWQDPPAIMRGAPFWSWNERLDPGRLCRQIESLKAAGMGGFFMHSRYGLKTAYLSDEWFRCVSACVEKARELGMKAYLYDEDRWPSGPAGGIVTRAHPEFRLHLLVASTPGDADPEAERIGLFAARLDGDMHLVSYRPIGEPAQAEEGEVVGEFGVRTDQPTGWTNDGGYLDTMDAEAVAEYMGSTHEEYRRRYSDDFGTVIPAIFTDEPNFGYWISGPTEKRLRVPWTRKMVEEFRRLRGYDIQDHLPEIVCRLAGDGFSKVRYDYHRTLTELFVRNFAQQIGDWCARYSIPLTGHVLLEGGLAVQIRAVGACMPFYEYQQWPGIDLLCDQADELITAKQCSSVADQLGMDRVLTELYGCTGWDWPLEGHKFIGDWEYAVGINFRCPHLTHYSLAGGAKRDYPASLCEHSPWWKYYRVVEDYFGRLSLMLTQGKPVRDVLIIHPVESGWGHFCAGAQDQDATMGMLEESLHALMYTLTGQHLDWDFADESLLPRHADADRQAFIVGRMRYKLVIVPPCVTLRATTVELLRRYVCQGGPVLFVGQQPTHIDAEPNDLIRLLIGQAHTCGATPEEFLPKARELASQRVSITEGDEEQTCVWAMPREVEDGYLLFMQSHDREQGHTVHVRAPGGGPVVLWDAMTGRRTLFNATLLEDFAQFDLPLGPTGSALLTLGVPIAGAEAAEPARRVVAQQSFAGPFSIELTEPNTLPLDYCRFRIGDGELSEPVPTLRADQLIRERYGLGTRLGDEHQPWYLYAMGTVDTKPRDRCELLYSFHVADVPHSLKLALERPEDYTVTVNGQAVGAVDGWFVDEDIKTVDVAGLVRAGGNEVRLAFGYRPDMELEDLYLSGDFGVARLDGQPPRPGNLTLVSPVRELSLGSWVGQGLDFYGAGLKCRVTVEAPGEGQRLVLRLPGIACTAAAVHVNGEAFVLPWAPFEADITDALQPGANSVGIEVIGGRKNILGPLHTPWETGTGPHSFSPSHPRWTLDYHLTDHGLMEPAVAEVME